MRLKRRNIQKFMLSISDLLREQVPVLSETGYWRARQSRLPAMARRVRSKSPTAARKAIEQFLARVDVEDLERDPSPCWSFPTAFRHPCGKKPSRAPGSCLYASSIPSVSSVEKPHDDVPSPVPSPGSKAPEALLDQRIRDLRFLETQRSLRSLP